MTVGSESFVDILCSTVTVKTKHKMTPRLAVLPAAKKNLKEEVAAVIRTLWRSMLTSLSSPPQPIYLSESELLQRTVNSMLRIAEYIRLSLAALLHLVSARCSPQAHRRTPTIWLRVLSNQPSAPSHGLGHFVAGYISKSPPLEQMCIWMRAPTMRLGPTALTAIPGRVPTLEQLGFGGSAGLIR